MIMIEIQGRGTALLLLMMPYILHQNNATVNPSYIKKFKENYHLKEDA